MDLRPATFPSYILTILLILLVDACSCRNYKLRSRLQFSAGEGYSNILVGIDQNVADGDCPRIIEQVQSLLSETSALLFSATDGAAYFSTIQILLPRGRCLSVNASGVANAGDSYEGADLKITDSQPLAQTLPWTRQYRRCSFGAEDIFVPRTNFLLSPTMAGREKAGLLLQEWTTFRYGVFEEFGHHGDLLYGACFKGGDGLNSYLSSCTSTPLPSLFQGDGDCRNEIENKKDDFLNRLGSDVDASSIMFMPHLDSVTRFCTNITHNSHSPTKQNIFCGGQSVSHVLASHADFASASFTRSFKNPLQLPPPINYTLMRHPLTNEYRPGLLIFIENTDLIREQNRLRYLKQSLASIISLLPFESMVGVGTIDGGAVTIPQLTSLGNDTFKASVIQQFPDLNSLTLAEKMALSNLTPPRQGGSINLDLVIRRALAAIADHASYDWHILVVTNARSEMYSEATASLSASSATLTVVTLDGGDSRWTELYGSSNTRSILSFPAECLIQSGACALWSDLVVEGVMDSMRQVTSQWHKVGEATLPRGQISGVMVHSLPPGSGTTGNYRFFITVFQPLPSPLNVGVQAPNGARCTVEGVLGYDYLLGVGGCALENGNWSVDLTGLSGTIEAQVSVWVEAPSLFPTLNILSSLGVDRKVEVGPNGGVPIYTRVSNGFGAPIISADVGVQLLKSSGIVYGSEILKDDGVDPDVTQDDGIYSGFLTNFSVTPEFHLGRITVTTTSARSKLINTVGLLDAALLDSRLSGKCCGSRVPTLSTTPLSNGRLTTMLPGFRTREDFVPGLLPPSRIGVITVVEDGNENIHLSFIAPGANLGQGSVSLYETCCRNDELQDGELSSCHAVIPANNCAPVQAGTSQSCTVTRSSLASKYLNSSTQDVVASLNCGLRGVNSAGLAGQVSMTTFVVEVTLAGTKGGTGECKSLSDDCLPISLFWGLIGCIGGLLLILLILIICWCAWAHRREGQQKTGAREEVLLRRSRPELSQQDVEDPKITQPPTTSISNLNQPSKESPLYNVYVNKAFITDGDGGMKLVAADGHLLPLDDTSQSIPPSSAYQPENHRNQHLDDRDPHNNASRFGGVSVVQVPPVRRRSVPDHEAGLKDDTALFKTYNRPQPPPKPARPNSQLAQQRNSVPIPRNRLPRPESGYANANKPPQEGELTSLDFPVYASVNRNGRSRTPVSSPLPNLNSGFSTFRPSSAPQRQGIPAHFGGRSKDDSFIPSSTRFTPKRYDAFPSSDSDTYSDMSRSVSVAPSLPPPQPPPFPTNRAKPPPYNPPPAAPPPPPPTQKKAAVEMQEDEYDDDSEHWDDEDFDFNAPGVSYA